ncbi:MAG: type VI secretion system baseplate subunit TssG [Gammaproteobacteria bacterium]|nr:type VI secretion system baseplate subunit TssG [Gammaproteobacteria bacterium]
MASKNWTTPRALTQGRLLQEKPYEFGFYSVLRKIECLHSDRPRLGKSIHPADDAIRLAQDPSLAFANATLAAFEKHDDGQIPRLIQRIFGLLGPNGPLPLHLTEYACNRMRNHGDMSFVRFLDLYHHRMLSFFYRAWAQAQPTVSFDRPDEDQFKVYIGALFGLGSSALWERDQMPDHAKLHYAGHLSCQTSHADGLQFFITEFFGIQSHIEQFVGQWLELISLDRWRLGESINTGTLGSSAVLGSRVWECQYKFRIVLGPMNFIDYQGFLPECDGLAQLISLVRMYAGDELDWDLKLILSSDEVPLFKLGAMGQLGWTTWMYSDSGTYDTGARVLNPSW